MLAWYVARVRTRSEERAASGLRELGHETFVPMAMVRVVSRRKVFDERPVFSGYVFLGSCPELYDVDGGWNWKAVRDTKNVISVVSSTCGPTQVHERVIADLQSLDIAGAFDERPKAEPSYRPGEPVKIISGPLADLAAEIRAVPSRRRLEVVLKASGRRANVPVEVVALVA